MLQQRIRISLILNFTELDRKETQVELMNRVDKIIVILPIFSLIGCYDFLKPQYETRFQNFRYFAKKNPTKEKLYRIRKFTVKTVFAKDPDFCCSYGERKRIEDNLKHNLIQIPSLEQDVSSDYAHEDYYFLKKVIGPGEAEKVQRVDQESEMKIIAADIKNANVKTKEKSSITVLKNWLCYCIEKFNINFINSVKAEDVKNVEEITKAEEEVYNKKYPKLQDIPNSQENCND